MFINTKRSSFVLTFIRAIVTAHALSHTNTWNMRLHKVNLLAWMFI